MDNFDGYTSAELLDIIAKLSFVNPVDRAVTINGAAYDALVICSYGDYHGSDLDAANYQELIERYGAILHTQGGYHEWSLLLVNDRGMPPFAVSDTDARDMIDTLKSVAADLAGLEQYPLLSEQTHSAYIDELAWRAWDQYLRSDVVRELDTYAPGGDASDAVFECDEDAFRQAYYDYDDNEWTADTATCVVNGRHRDAVRHVAEIVFGWDVAANLAAHESRERQERSARLQFDTAWSDYLDWYPLPFFDRHAGSCREIIFNCLYATGRPMTVDSVRAFVAAEGETAAYRDGT
jgi:hypothetical protein